MIGGFEKIRTALSNFLVERGLSAGKTSFGKGEDPVEEAGRLLEEAASGRGGAFASRAKAARVGEIYSAAGEDGRRRIRALLADLPGTGRNLAEAAAKAAASSDPSADGSAEALRRALRGPREGVLSSFATIPCGVELLVRMRGEILSGDGPETAGLEADLSGLLGSWFDPGLLEIRRVDWDSPASVLERLMRYEAVHPIVSWDDLKNRLAADRRCYALFHPRMPGDPLAFVEVALTRGIAPNIHSLLDIDAPTMDGGDADTAIFYSITNAHEGLRGVPLGEHLIRKAVSELNAELAGVGVFSTLSPIPGLRGWIAALSDGEGLEIAGVDWPAAKDFAQDPQGAPDEPLRRPLSALAAAWLLKIEGGKPCDPVARFHLRNGARIERINWHGDLSRKGLRQSCGLMVNYLYDPERLEARHDALAEKGEICASPAVFALASPGSAAAKGEGLAGKAARAAGRLVAAGTRKRRA